MSVKIGRGEERQGDAGIKCQVSEAIASCAYTKVAFEATMEIFELTKSFPAEEKYSLVDQIRRSSRSVCANIGEAWRKRRYPAHFVSKLSDSETEAEETRVWLEVSLHCKYIENTTFDRLDSKYDLILGQLVKMGSEPNKWTIK